MPLLPRVDIDEIFSDETIDEIRIGGRAIKASLQTAAADGIDTDDRRIMAICRKSDFPIPPERGAAVETPLGARVIAVVDDEASIGLYKLTLALSG